MHGGWLGGEGGSAIGKGVGEEQGVGLRKGEGEGSEERDSLIEYQFILKSNIAYI